MMKPIREKISVQKKGQLCKPLRYLYLLVAKGYILPKNLPLFHFNPNPHFLFVFEFWQESLI